MWDRQVHLLLDQARQIKRHGNLLLLRQDWIYEQLLVVAEPLHPTLPPLMQEFVNSVLVSAITTPPRSSGYGGNAAAATSNNHTPFSAEEVST